MRVWHYDDVCSRPGCIGGWIASDGKLDAHGRTRDEAIASLVRQQRIISLERWLPGWLPKLLAA